MGKFSDSYRQLKRTNRQVRLRQKHINAYPWFDGEAEKVIVMNSLNPDKKFKTEIISVCNGYHVGLLFELAGRQIINEIKCPMCGETATLNVHWQGFRCKSKEAIWEIVG